MSSTIFSESSPYFKSLFHSFKFPFAPINGVFIGKRKDDKTVEITDCVPLCHSTSSICTTPLVEMALIQIDRIIGDDLTIVGYYFGTDYAELSSDFTVPSIHTSIFTKISENFPGALLWMLEDKKLNQLSKSMVFKTYQLKSSKLVPCDCDIKGLQESDFQTLADHLEKSTFDSLVDFEIHTDNPSLDYFNKSLKL
ncbi:predicted protein [Naegleria gruberi]|uniref:Predicted protein n=1 Tax=Naegleria gruberi TaxID=5762 RepID=D2VG68_NAEGR|nr:uncharacterized protein NAEGRDRAFT_67871 [Naegleria gruberi]EFC44219.1 predicted protein [Naegleria gruberi]|eukprot:XP_002676963.1 predicted protein [Naegleria gruberi strain NEG-M]